MHRARLLGHRSFPTLTHYARLSALLGPRHAANEVGWMMEHIVGKNRYDTFRYAPAGQAGPNATQAQAGARSSASVSSVLSAAELHRLDAMMHARAVLRQPLQYLLGSVSFLGLPLMTRAPVLIPRPETECMVGWILARWQRRDYTQRYTHMQIQRETNLSDVSVWTQQANKTRQEQQAGRTESDAVQAAAAAAAAASSSPPPLRALDLCSGSGNIALSLAHHLPTATRRSVHAVGVDVNPAAIALAQDNLAEMQKHGLCSNHEQQWQRSCSFTQLDLMQRNAHDNSTDESALRRMMAQQAVQDPLLAALADPPAAVADLVRLAGTPSSLVSRPLSPLACSPCGPYDLVVSNPPYIPFREHSSLQSEVRDWEDFSALVAGEEGMDLYDAILRMLPSLVAPTPAGEGGGSAPSVVMELGSASQALTLADRLQSLGFNFVTIHHDLADLPRWIAAARTTSNSKRTSR